MLVTMCYPTSAVAADNISALVRSILSGLYTGVVAPSLSLLYAVIQLTHSRLTPRNLDRELLHDYLELVALLLSHIPSSHVTMEGVAMEEEDMEGDDLSVEDVDVDPLSSHDAMLRHCIASVGGGQLPKCLQQLKYVIIHYC